jgi:hypothetical protein
MYIKTEMIYEKVSNFECGIFLLHNVHHLYVNIRKLHPKTSNFGMIASADYSIGSHFPTMFPFKHNFFLEISVTAGDM